MSRLPSLGPSLTHHLVENQRQMQRQANSSAFARSGASVVAPGMWASDDFDGVDRDHLGTTGWALGSADGGPSYFVLNGRNVFDDLAAKDVQILDLIADLAAKDVQILALIADLAARVTVTQSIASFTSSYLPADSAWHVYGADIPITIAVPTGKLTVTVGCGTARITHDSSMSQIVAEATFSISGGIASYGDIIADGAIYDPTLEASMPLSVTHAFTVSPGTYTIVGKMRAQGASGTGAFVYFQNPYLTVQVTG